LAVVGLVLGDGGQRAAVILEVELAVPGREFAGIGVHAFSQAIEIGDDAFELDPWCAGDAALEADAALDHGAGGAATAVAIAIGHDHFTVGGLGLVALPGTHGLGDGEIAIVSGVDGVALIALGGDELGLGHRAVDAAPEEAVVGMAVGVI